MKTICRFFAFGFFCFFWNGAGNADSTPTATDIFTKILESRRSIQTGRIAIETTYSEPGVQAIQKKWVIWFDLSKMRSEVTSLKFLYEGFHFTVRKVLQFGHNLFSSGTGRKNGSGIWGRQ